MTDREGLLELINILDGSCTTFADNSDGTSHEHGLFDNVDRNRLATLQAELRKPA
jgi:hypothetical protein